MTLGGRPRFVERSMMQDIPNNVEKLCHLHTCLPRVRMDLDSLRAVEATMKTVNSSLPSASPGWIKVVASANPKCSADVASESGWRKTLNATSWADPIAASNAYIEVSPAARSRLRAIDWRLFRSSRCINGFPLHGCMAMRVVCGIAHFC